MKEELRLKLKLPMFTKDVLAIRENMMTFKEIDGITQGKNTYNYDDNIKKQIEKHAIPIRIEDEDGNVLKRIIAVGKNLWLCGYFNENESNNMVYFVNNLDKLEKTLNYKDSDQGFPINYETIVSTLKKLNQYENNYRDAFLCAIFLSSEIIKNEYLERVIEDMLNRHANGDDKTLYNWKDFLPLYRNLDTIKNFICKNYEIPIVNYIRVGEIYLGRLKADISIDGVKIALGKLEAISYLWKKKPYDREKTEEKLEENN